MKTTALKLSQIACDSGTQSRMNINEDVVQNYAERMEAGDEFPPVDVFADGSAFHLADGFHRIMAASRVGMGKFECVVHNGTAADALWFAIGANRKNGCHMSAADKRHAITVALTKFTERTQQQIADHVGCTKQYVSRVQSELSTSGQLTLPAKRVGKDGKTRKTSYAKRPDPTACERAESEGRPLTAAHIRTAVEELNETNGGEPTEPNTDRPEPTPSACPHLPDLAQVKNDIAAAISDLEAFETGTEDFNLDNCADVANALRDAAKALLKAQREF